MMRRGGDRRREKRLSISNNLEKPWEWALFTAGWSKEGEEEGIAGRKVSLDAESLVETTASTHWDVMGKTQTLPPNDLSLSPSLSLAWFFCYYYDFPQAGISVKDIS